SAWFINPQVPVVQDSDGFLFNDILIFIKPTFDSWPISYSIVSYLLIFTQAISFNHYINSRKMMQKNNYLPAMSYLLITSLFIYWNILSAPLVINTLLIWVWAKLTNLYKNQNVKSTLFNICLVIGICSFFYFPSLAFIIMVIFALLFTRAPKVAEWLMPIMGVFTTFYFLFAYLFLTNKLYRFSLPGFTIAYPPFTDKKIIFIIMMIVVLLALVGIYYVNKSTSKQVVQVRKRWKLLLLYLMVAILIPFINTTPGFEYWIIAALPVSALVASAFFYPKIRWIPMVMHWILVGFVIYMQYFE
ncbi:MAG: DUF6427 family protein, partial [Ginsengibacter sp.]